MAQFIGRASNRHREAPYVMEFVVPQGVVVPDNLHYKGESYEVRRRITSHGGRLARVSRLPFMTDFNPNPFHTTPTGRLVLDSKRAETRARRRKRERAEAKAAKRKTYGWGEYNRTEGRTNPNAGGERAQAKDRKKQRKLEQWVMKVGAWKPELGFNKAIHYVKNVTKAGGMDFEVRTIKGDKLVGRIDAKSEFKTTPAQDRQIEQAWKDSIPCFLVGRTKYLQLTPRTKRRDNGSIWG